MALWFPVSQFFVVALLNWNVLCCPHKGLKQVYSLSQGFPAPHHVVDNPAVTYSSEHRRELPGYENNFPSIVSEHSMGSLNAPSGAPAHPSSHVVSKTPQQMPPFQGGEYLHYGGNSDHGHLERETADLSPMLPPPPLPPFPEPDYKAGELNHYEASFEHGNDERETEEQGLPPWYPHGAPVETVEFRTSQPADTSLLGPGPYYPYPNPYSLYYLFMNGRHPPGTVTFSNTDYEHGGNHWQEVRYKRFHYPALGQELSPGVPQQTNELSSDLLSWHRS